MKVRDMNKNQLAVYQLMDKWTTDVIGGFENQMEDNEEGSAAYEEAKSFLSKSHEEMKQCFFDAIRADREAQKHLKFVGNDFLLERIERRLTKWGY